DHRISKLNGVIQSSPSAGEAVFVNQQFIDNISDIDGATAPGTNFLAGTRHGSSSLSRFAGRPVDPESFLCDSLGERLHGLSAGRSSRHDGADGAVAASVSAGVRAGSRRPAALAPRSLPPLLALTPP